MAGLRPDQLGAAIARNLASYSREVEEEMQQVIKENAQLGVKLLRRNSPKRTGDYAKGWTLRKERNGGYTIWNKKHYRITHLLEKGHALQNGGRTQAQPHIAPVEQQLLRTITQDITEVLGG